MKKYVKPELVYESFELSQQIAACKFDSNDTANDEGCEFTGYDDALGKIITIFQSHCSDAENNGFWIESYCYHNASEGEYGIFNS